MRGRLLVKTRGKHPFLGRYNSRGQRTMSKIHKGMPHKDLTEIFKKIDKEKYEETKQG